MDRKLGAGIIGSGFMARTHAEITTRFDTRVRLTGVSGGSRAPAFAEDYGTLLMDTPESLIRAAGVDFVIIATPESSHLKYVTLAAECGKHVFLEKPMAATGSECREMIKLCEQAGIKFMVAHSQRFRKVHQRAKFLLDDGVVGKIRQLNLVSFLPESVTRAAADKKPWYKDPDGGFYLGHCVHLFDMMHWLAGSRPSQIFASIASSEWHDVPNLSVMTLVQFESGITGQLSVCLDTPEVIFPDSRFRTRVTGEKGLMDFDGYSHLDLAVRGEWTRILTQEPINIGDPRDPVRLESYALQNQLFINSILRKTSEPVTGEDGKIAVDMCLAALKSSRSGQPVRFGASIVQNELKI